MLKFVYSAKDKSGKTIKGEVEAGAREQAIGILRGKGLFILKLEETRGGGINFQMFKLSSAVKVPIDELVLFTRQMATMTASGITIVTALDTLEIMPAISSFSGNNPAYKVFTVYRDTFKPIDYRSLNYDLATNPSQFNNYYTFSTAFSLQGLLDASLVQLTPQLVTTTTKQAFYRSYYYSGHNSPVSAADTLANPITNTNWPFYWCGLGKMGQQEYIACVNSY